MCSLIISNKTFAQPTQASYKGFQFAKFNQDWKVWDGTRFWDVSRNTLKLKFAIKPDSTYLNGFMNDYHLQLRHESAMHYFYFEIDSGYDLMQTILTIDTVSNLSFLAPNITPIPLSVSNDTYFSNSQTYGYQWYLDQIGVPAAWAITHGSPNVTVAVIGQGIDWEHEDLGFGADNYHSLWTNVADTWNTPWPAIPAANVPGDNTDGNSPPNGYIDDFIGANIVSDFDPNIKAWHVGPAQVGAHEVMVSGIIGAKTNNGLGIAGIAGGWGTEGARIMTISFFSYPFQGTTLSDAIAPSILYAVNNGADIINFSYGYFGTGTNSFYQDIYDAIDYAYQSNVLFVAGSGNVNCPPVYFPASHPKAVGVGGTDRDDNRWERFAGCGQDFGANYGPELDIAAPAMDINSTFWDNSNSNYNYWSDVDPNLSFGTSFATPIVAGVAALMKSANPCISVEDLQAILKGTASKTGPYDYHWDWERPGHSIELGYGRVNAGNAVTVANDLYSASPDLYLRDLEDDYGLEPNQAIINNNGAVWISNDIWVRNSNDNQTQHQNPIDGQVNYVYVKVRNRSCAPSASSGNNLKLYWTKANTNPTWPDMWDASISEEDLFPGSGNPNAPMGDIIGTQTIPAIDGGAYSILVFPWTPNNSIYTSTSTDWHFCLLARIESSADPMAQTETGNLYENVYQNNNIVLKNIEVILVVSGPEPVKPEANVAVGNAGSLSTFTISFGEYLGQYYSQVTKEAEVHVILDSLLCQKWYQGGQRYNDIRVIDSCKFKIAGKDAEISAIEMDSLTYGNIAVSFKFLVDSVDNQFKKYQFNLVQKDEANDHVIGGETFEIIKNPRALFQANAGPDKYINEGDSVTLTATDVGEDADYAWYNAQQQLLGKGLSITIGPATDQTYTLMVVADSDAYTDYDEVNVHVATNIITSLNPNPADASVKVYYETHAQAIVRLQIVNQFGSTMLEQNGSSGQADVSFNTNNLTNGNYGVLLLCNGVIMDYAVLIVQH
jgi:subtilisin family serine protease